MFPVGARMVPDLNTTMPPTQGVTVTGKNTKADVLENLSCKLKLSSHINLDDNRTLNDLQPFCCPSIHSFF